MDIIVLILTQIKIEKDKPPPHDDVTLNQKESDNSFSALRCVTIAMLMYVCTLFSGTLYESDWTRGTIRKFVLDSKYYHIFACGHQRS
jgi:hypothetical protein